MGLDDFVFGPAVSVDVMFTLSNTCQSLSLIIRHVGVELSSRPYALGFLSTFIWQVFTFRSKSNPFPFSFFHLGGGFFWHVIIK